MSQTSVRSKQSVPLECIAKKQHITGKQQYYRKVLLIDSTLAGHRVYSSRVQQYQKNYYSKPMPAAFLALVFRLCAEYPEKRRY